jgi:hypothetical protein
MKFRCTLNVLLLATLAVMDNFVSVDKKKDRDTEAASSKNSGTTSNTYTVCKKPKRRKICRIDSRTMMEKKGHSV